VTLGGLPLGRLLLVWVIGSAVTVAGVLGAALLAFLAVLALADLTSSMWPALAVVVPLGLLPPVLGALAATTLWAARPELVAATSGWGWVLVGTPTVGVLHVAVLLWWRPWVLVDLEQTLVALPVLVLSLVLGAVVSRWWGGRRAVRAGRGRGSARSAVSLDSGG
jgi:hypothetical protein